MGRRGEGFGGNIEDSWDYCLLTVPYDALLPNTVEAKIGESTEMNL